MEINLTIAIELESWRVKATSDLSGRMKPGSGKLITIYY